MHSPNFRSRTTARRTTCRATQITRSCAPSSNEGKIGVAAPIGGYVRWSAARSVVVAGREDDDLCFSNDVDEAVLVVDPPGPCPGQVVLERLGLADAGERIPPDVLDQLIDPREHLAVGLEPGRVVLPALILKCQPHWALPTSASASIRACSAMRMPFRAFS